VGPPEAVPPWLTEELQTAHCGAKIEKLIRSGYDETHLFLHIDGKGEAFPVFYEMSWEGTLPPESPDLPPRLTHVWLARRWARRVLTYDEDSGWRAHHPYDN